MPQTTVKNRQARWLVEGQRASTHCPRIDGTMQAAYNGNSGILPFGRVSVLNPVTNLVTTLAGAPAAGSLLIIPIFTERYGLSLETLSTRPALDVGYPEGQDIQIEYITEGDVVMWSEEAVNAGDVVHYRAVATGAEIPGRVRKTADSTDTAILTGCYFTHSTTGPGLVSVTTNGLVRV